MTEKNLDFFLNNPELNKRHARAIPNEEMYRFFPPKNEVIDINKSDPKNSYRYIFNGQPKTEYEQKKINQFLEYESKNGKLKYPPNWLESNTMRLLQAAEFDIKKAYTLVQENIEWLNKIPKTINDTIIYLLNSGFMYVYGRDCHYRPIIVVSIKILKVVLSQQYTFDDINRSIIYLMNYIIKYLLIPGQIENWIIFVDFLDVGISDVGEFKKILSTLSKHRGRVYKNYFVNISGLLKLSVKTAVKMFSSVAKKLIILGSDELQKVQEIISPENIEKKYGGLAPNVIPGDNNLFPPVMPSNNFGLRGEKINIISPEDYKEMCLNSNPYKPFVVCPKYEEIWRKESEERKLFEELKRKSATVQENEENLLKNKNSKTNTNPEGNKKGIKPKTYENKRLNNHLNLINKMGKKNNRNEINEFLSEFDGFNMLDNFEERKYCIPSPINIKEINIFFERVKENQNFYKLN
jgi:hypothetical protein